MSKLAVAAGIILVIVLAVSALVFIPVSAFGGSTQVKCSLNVIITGAYTDYLVVHYIANFEATGTVSKCSIPTVINGASLIPSGNIPAFNIGGFTLTFAFTLTDSNGVVHCRCSDSVHIQSLQTSYSFVAETSVSGLLPGTYQLNIISPYPINGASGSTAYSTAVVVSTG